MQGLRAVAVGFVLLYHAGVPLVPGGYIGVDVFFVISGFLITAHLLGSLRSTGRVPFAAFYARRALRILPASLAVALLTALGVLWIYPPSGARQALEDALATVLYVPNIRFAIQDTDYLADHSASPYQHYWSLGVEEQFYLLWPLILLALFAASRRRWGWTAAAVLLLAAASLAACVGWTSLQQPIAFFLPFTRAWELLAGALVAFAVPLTRARLRPGLARAAGWVGLLLICAGAALLDDGTAFPGIAATIPVMGTALVICAGEASGRLGPAAVLSLRPLQWIGLISYSLYLVHWPLLVLSQAALGPRTMSVPAKVLVGVVLAVPVAFLLFRLVEQPLRAPVRLTRRPARVTLLTALGATFAAVILIGGGIVWSAVRPDVTGTDVASAPDAPVRPPSATAFVPQDMTPAIDDAPADIPRLYADGCHHGVTTETVQTCEYGTAGGAVRIALFGDSHSAQWFPALEDVALARDDLSVSTYTKSSCPAVATTVLDKNVPYMSCDRWRDAVLRHLVGDPPDLVVISSYAWYELADAQTPAQRLEEWSGGLTATVSALTDAGAQVMVIADTPRFDSSPVSCIAATPLDVRQCAGDPDAILDADMRDAEEASTRAAGGRFADLTGYICDDASCPVVAWDLLVYRDVNHLTSTYVRYLAPILAGELQSVLPPPR